MAKKQINIGNFESILERPGIVLVDCWAPWCSACKEFTPIFERVAERHPEHLFATLNTQAEPELTESAGISHIPALMLYRDGVLLFKQPGYVDEAGLDDIVDQAVALDMNMVRADIAEQAANES